MVTIKDIAKQAGVSVSTTSRALNDNPRISQETRERVKKIAAELGYQPNYTARNLTRGESNMVGLIFQLRKIRHQQTHFILTSCGELVRHFSHYTTKWW